MEHLRFSDRGKLCSAANKNNKKCDNQHGVERKVCVLIVFVCHANGGAGTRLGLLGGQNTQGRHLHGFIRQSCNKMAININDLS